MNKDKIYKKQLNRFKVISMFIEGNVKSLFYLHFSLIVIDFLSY